MPSILSWRRTLQVCAFCFPSWSSFPFGLRYAITQRWFTISTSQVCPSGRSIMDSPCRSSSKKRGHRLGLGELEPRSSRGSRHRAWQLSWLPYSVPNAVETRDKPPPFMGDRLYRTKGLSLLGLRSNRKRDQDLLRLLLELCKHCIVRQLHDFSQGVIRRHVERCPDGS